ncbi:hypothetical protein F5B18DRAFT_656541 [Nemania serpens]|nr:hypothetical protein F5B18DRAFT_656541 [Nemania serpens]
MPSFKSLILATVAAATAQAYSNNCDGSFLSPSSSDCQAALGNINTGNSYSDQSQFSSGTCYVIYATNDAGPQPVINTATSYKNGSNPFLTQVEQVSGQTILDTANAILA